MDYLKITQEYYSCWLGKSGIISESGVEYVYSEERNRVQAGYGRKFDLWIWRGLDNIIISYGDSAKPKIGLLKDILDGNSTTEEISDAAAKLCNADTAHGVKYVWKGAVGKSLKAKILTEKDYPIYEQFFKSCHPDCKNTDWLKEYFLDMAADKLCCGIMTNGVLASCTDAPESPYMQSAVQEIGINTLPRYRKKGYGADCCLLCAEQIITAGKCPLWSADIKNQASRRLAESIGFDVLGEYIGVCFRQN